MYFVDGTIEKITLIADYVTVSGIGDGPEVIAWSH
jgi:hypothetical protein